MEEVFDKIYSLCNEDEFDKYFDEQSLIEKRFRWNLVKRTTKTYVLNESKPKYESSAMEVWLPTINLPPFNGNV